MKFTYSKITLTVILTIFSSVVQAGKSSSEKSGDVLQVLIPATAYATTFLIDDKEGRNQFYKSFLATLVVTHTLKYVVNKPRQQNNGDYSFPSGHTSSAFQGAAFIHKRYGFKYSIPAYLGAAYVGWSRVEGESDKHDFTDVAAGALIGVLSNYYFVKQYNNLVITPVADSKNIGVNFSYQW